MRTTTTVHWNPGKVSEPHNLREEELCSHESHIDFYNEHGGSFHEVLFHKNLEDVYEEEFGDAMAQYNEKQKRPDRQITVESYMKSVEMDTRGKKQTKKVNGKRVVNEDAKRQGKQTSYEVTIHAGNTYKARDENGKVLYDENNNHVRREELPLEVQRKIMKRYYETFQDENPNFRLVNVVEHHDEGFYNRRGVWEYSDDHLHIEFVPIAHGYKQGLSVQNSMNKAMKEMGIDDPECYDLWAKKEQARLDEITREEYISYCEEHPDFAKTHGDLEIYHPITDKSKEGGKSKEQLSMEEELDEAIHEIETLKHELDKQRHNNEEWTEDLIHREQKSEDLEEYLSGYVEKIEAQNVNLAKMISNLQTWNDELEERNSKNLQFEVRIRETVSQVTGKQYDEDTDLETVIADFNQKVQEVQTSEQKLGEETLRIKNEADKVVGLMNDLRDIASKLEQYEVMKDIGEIQFEAHKIRTYTGNIAKVMQKGEIVLDSEKYQKQSKNSDYGL